MRRQAHQVWIYVPGISTATRWCGLVNVDEPTVRNLESQIKRYAGLAPGRVAYAVWQPVTSRRRDQHRTCNDYNYECGDALFSRWRTLNRNGRWLRRAIWRLKRRFPLLEIGLVLEDFAVRWYCYGNIPVDYLILDTPILSDAECERWRHLLDRPGVLRRSQLSRMTPWVWDHRWKVGFRRNEWCCRHLEEWRDSVGVWRRPSETQTPLWCSSVFESFACRRLDDLDPGS